MSKWHLQNPSTLTNSVFDKNPDTLGNIWAGLDLKLPWTYDRTTVWIIAAWKARWNVGPISLDMGALKGPQSISLLRSVIIPCYRIRQFWQLLQLMGNEVVVLARFWGWTGFGAVCDWLYSHSGVHCPSKVPWGPSFCHGRFRSARKSTNAQKSGNCILQKWSSLINSVVNRT